jgi:hypothetical protein
MPPPPRRHLASGAKAPAGDDAAWGPGQQPLALPADGGERAPSCDDAGAASPSTGGPPPRKRPRSGLEHAAAQQAQPQQQPVGAAAPLALFVSEPGGFSPLSPIGGRMRRSSVMSSATVAPCLPPISPLDLGGFDHLTQQDQQRHQPLQQQQQDEQHQHQHQHQQAAPPPGKGGAGAPGAATPLAAGRSPARLALGPLSVDMDLSAVGTLTPHLTDVLTPGRLLLGSPVDLGDALERAVDVAAELGLGGAGAADMCGLLASPGQILTSPRGALFASLRDIVLASPLGKVGGAEASLTTSMFGGGAAGGAGAAAGGGCGDAGGDGRLPGGLAGELSPIAAALQLESAPRRAAWGAQRAGGRAARASLLPMSPPQPELSAWVPCSTASTGGATGSASRTAAPAWLSQQLQQAGGPRGGCDVRRAPCRATPQRLSGVGAHGGPVPWGVAAAQPSQPPQPHDDTAFCFGHADVGPPRGRASRWRPFHGRHGVPPEVLRELPARAPAPRPMLATMDRVWECAARAAPRPAAA